MIQSLRILNSCGSKKQGLEWHLCKVIAKNDYFI